MDQPPPRPCLATPCRACRAPKPLGFYLCATCWVQLPPSARRALNRRDSRAFHRVRELHHHIDSGRPLADLEITR